MNRYYSTQRPIVPGSYPAPEWVDYIINFPDRIFCEEIRREAWGYIDYRQPLTAQQIEDYELVEIMTVSQVTRYLELLARRDYIVMHSGIDWQPEWEDELKEIDEELARLRLLMDEEHERRKR